MKAKYPGINVKGKLNILHGIKVKGRLNIPV